MTENNEFDEVMKDITRGFTGDVNHDLMYLQEQAEKYKGHKYEKEILRACGRLMYEIIPDEKKEEIAGIVSKDNMGFDAALDEVKFNIYKKNYDRALELIEEMVSKYEELDLFANDSVSEYYCFTEPMEEIIYRHSSKSNRDFRKAEIDYVQLYLTYGILLVEMKRFDDAAKALEKAKRWNPVNSTIAFEYIETFKMRNMLEDFAALTRKCFKFVFKPKDLARCYRNMAYYFVEIEDYKAAVCCLKFSGQFENNEMISSELYYISQKTGEVYNPNEEDFDKVFKKYSIPVGPELEVLKLAYSYGKHFYEQQDDNGTAYFWGIFADFIDDEEVNNVLKVIEKKEL